MARQMGVETLRMRLALSCACDERTDPMLQLRHQSPRRHHVIRWLAALIGIVLLPCAASAQIFGGGGGTPPVSSREIDRYAELLELSPAQREAVDDLFEGMLQEHLDAVTERDEAMDDLRAEAEETNDHRLMMEELPEVMGRYRDRSEDMKDALFDDLRLLLSADQEAHWPRLERMRRRLTLAGNGQLSGESVDLIELTRDMELSDDTRQALAPVLDRYEVAFDRALQEREEQRKASMMALPDGGGAMEIDFEALMASREKVREASQKVCEVNSTYARQVEGVLPDSRREAFEEAMRRASFPQVYRDSYTGTVIGTVEGFEDLTPEQQSEVDAIRAAYERELASVNDAWAGAIADAEAEGGSGGPMRFAGGAGGGMVIMTDAGDTEEIEEARTARRDLDRRYLSRVRDLLSTEQRSRLPRRSEVRREGTGSQGGGNFMAFEMIVDDGGNEEDVNVTGGDR